MNKNPNSAVTELIRTLTLAAVIAIPGLALADDIPIPHPKNDNMMKNTTARHAAAGMVHFNEVDGQPTWISSK